METIAIPEGAIVNIDSSNFRVKSNMLAIGGQKAWSRASDAMVASVAGAPRWAGIGRDKNKEFEPN